MYATHQRQIARFAKQSPDNFSQVCLMVLLSIMQQWSTVGRQMQDVRANGLDSKFFFASKRKGWEYILENKQELYDVVYGKLPLEDKILMLSSIPGIQIAKSGFILQLCIGKVACLDVHNLKRFGLSENTFKLGKTSYATALKKAKLYVKTCEELGGTQSLWDSWCNLIAEKYPNTYRDGNHVSKLHMDYLK